MTRRLIKNPDEARITITAGSDSPPSCLVTWNAREMVLPCPQVGELARDMVAAAARAEAEAAAVHVFRVRLGAPDGVVGGYIADLRAAYGQRELGVRGLLTLVPGVSLFDGSPFVHARVKPYEPLRLPPDVLRSMAMDWLVCAESAERDAILRYALADTTDLTAEQIADVFAAMRNVRPDGLRDRENPTVG